MQRGLRILPEFGSSLAILNMNLRIENKDFDLDEFGALHAINSFYNKIAEAQKVSDMPNMIPDQHMVKQTSRLIATDQSIARIPIFSSIFSTRNFKNDLSGLFSTLIPEYEQVTMITIPHLSVKQIIYHKLGATAIHFKLPGISSDIT
jgi:hypothetical protein